MYKTKHFVIQELVPRHVYEDRGWKAWELLDDRALRTLDLLRKEFGVTVVNNWHTGGDRQWSGLRTPESPYGSIYSQHRLGQAFDCIFPQEASEDVREHILAHPEEFPFIRELELGISWMHFSVANRRGSSIFTYTP
jgi:hypothetical protein